VDECSATRVFYSFLRGIQLKEIGSFTINAKEKKKEEGERCLCKLDGKLRAE
jgi:hypothetical protein